MESTSSFDLLPAAKWVDDNCGTLLKRTQVLRELASQQESFLYADVRGLDLLGGQINFEKLLLGLSLFPEPATARWVPAIVQGSRACWFHRDSTPDAPLPTRRLGEALGPTAVAPSHIQYLRDRATGWHTLIRLFRLPRVLLRQLKHPATAFLILFQGYVHELAHRLIIADWVNLNSPLVFPDGSIFAKSEEAVLHFADLVERCDVGPISHYSSGYWKDGGTRLRLDAALDGEKTRFQVPAQEELAETITGYLLGFAFRETVPGRAGRSLDPFDDLSDIRRFVKQYLHAQCDKRGI